MKYKTFFLITFFLNFNLTPLHIAVKLGLFGIVKLLLKHKNIDKEKRDSNGFW